MGTRRLVLMTGVKSLATRVYRLKCGHAPTEVYLKWFSHWEDDKCWWCGRGGRIATQTPECLFHHFSLWRYQQLTLWKAVGKAKGWEKADADTCRCLRWFRWKNATKYSWTSWRLLKLGTSHPDEWWYGWSAETDSCAGGSGDEGIYLFIFVAFLFSPCIQFIFAPIQSLNFHIYISGDEKGRGEEIGHLASLPGGGGGIWFCQTLTTVHTVWISNNIEPWRLPTAWWCSWSVVTSLVSVLTVLLSDREFSWPMALSVTSLWSQRHLCCHLHSCSGCFVYWL